MSSGYYYSQYSTTPTTMPSNTSFGFASATSSLATTSSTSSSRNNSITGAMSFTPSISEPIDIYSLHPRSNSSTQASRCAYPSWPTGEALVRNPSQTSNYSNPSSYVSDEDLFGDDDETYLSEPPPPPRSAEVWMAKPLLPPVVEMKAQYQQPRRSSNVQFSKTKKRSGVSGSSKRKE